MTKTHLKHKYLIKNNCPNAIELKQLRFNDSIEVTIDHDSIMPVRFAPSDKKSHKRFINFGVAGYEWSDDIQINSLNLHYFMLRHKQGRTIPSDHGGFQIEQFITLCIEVAIQEDSNLIVVRRETEKGSFRFVNNLDDMIVFLSQDGEKLHQGIAEVFLHEQQGSCYYSWPSSLSKKREIFISVYNIKTQTRSDIVKLEYSKATMSYDLLSSRIYHQSEMVGGTMMCTFTHFPRKIQDNYSPNTKIHLEIPYLGLSVIGGLREGRRELLFLSISDLKVDAEFFEKKKKLRAKIRYFNIDNNSEFLSFYPIFFSPKISYENMIANDLNHIDLYVSLRNKSDAYDNMTIIKKVDLKMIGNVIKIEESFIHFALSAFDIANKERKISQAFLLKSQVRELEFSPEHNADYTDRLAQAAHKNYKNLEYKNVEPSTTYINELAIGEHDISLSLKRERGDAAKAALNRYSKYLKSYGFDYLVFSIEDLTISFNPFILPNDIYPLQAVQKQLIKQYRNDAIKSALASLLDLNILGNPSKVFRELRTGAQDLVNKPSQRAEEYNNSLYGLSRGVGEGTKSMAKHTAMGTLGAVSTITGTLGNITSGLSFDKRYMKERTRLRTAQANKDMGTMTTSLKQLGFSFKDSVAGIFTKPAEMAEKEDVWGAVKGSFIGVGGLIAKPITGLLDFASNLAKGGRDALDTENLAPSTMRVRNPRAFYGKTGYIK